MYENQTYENILDNMLSRISSDIDKSEGSLIYNALAPEAWELAQVYIAIDTIYNNTFADTAPREELILRAKERGMAPNPATNAILKGVFNMDIPLGSRFSLDELNYTAIEQMYTGTYKMQCETKGSIGNKRFGTILPIEFIEGLESAALTELLIPGTDEEETEAFRTRYFDSFRSFAFGGNKADYIEKVKEISGIGGVKVNRATADNCNVQVQLITSEYGVPSAELVNMVQQILDPTQDGGGIGMAPIGHIVQVQGVEGLTVHITTAIVMDTGYVWEDISNNINLAIDHYFLSLSKNWEAADNIIIRIAQLEAELLDVEGVVDISGTQLNGVPANITLSGNQIPVRGTVNANA